MVSWCGWRVYLERVGGQPRVGPLGLKEVEEHLAFFFILQGGNRTEATHMPGLCSITELLLKA